MRTTVDLPRLPALVRFLCLVPVTSSAVYAQSAIPEFIHQTDNYRLVVFGAGHFAIDVGGIWMPGCVCLDVNGVPQYQSKRLSRLKAHVSQVKSGRRLVITGQLTEDIAFTQTLVARADSVHLTYAVQALRDLDNADVFITAAPQVDHLAGKRFEVVAGGGRHQETLSAGTVYRARRVRAVTWHDIGGCTTTVEFHRCEDAGVELSVERGLYRVTVFGPGPMKAGQQVSAEVTFTAAPSSPGAARVRTMSGMLGHLRFGVSGVAGLVHHLRTDRGLIIQQFSINEDNVHQVSVGRNVGDQWGGVRVRESVPGRRYVVEAEGDIVNHWRQRVEARRVSDRVDEIELSAHRSTDKPTKRLRLLMYVARRLEKERVPFWLETPDGRRLTEDHGDFLWMGMPPRSEEEGLGLYRVLGKFPAGVRVVMPLPHRGEVLCVTLNQPAEICDYRFGVYFRGLWFQYTRPQVEDVSVTVRVERMPERHVGPLTVWDSTLDHTSTFSAGGVPLLVAVGTGQGGSRWSWRKEDQAATGTLTATSRRVTMRIPLHLWGKRLQVAPGTVDLRAGVKAQWLRFGADLPPVKVRRSAHIEFAPTATERCSLSPLAAVSMRLSRTAAGVATLSFTSDAVPWKLAFGYRRLAAPPPDPLARRADPRPLERPDPGPYGGLQVIRDAPNTGDVTLTTPWWEVVHSARKGGAITSIRFFHGMNENILRSPLATHLFTSSRQYSDARETKPAITVASASPTRVHLHVAGRLLDASGRSAGTFRHDYEYRPMLVRRTCEYDFDEPISCTGLEVGSLHLAPWFDEAVARRDSRDTTWLHAVFPGPPVFTETSFARYLCLFRRGVEGIDWLPAADLDQWRRPGRSLYAVRGDREGNPTLTVQPLALGGPPTPLPPRVRFESYLSLPQIRRHQPRRHFIMCLKNGDCTPEFLRFAAEYGVTDILLGAANVPGTFRLGDLEASRTTVARAHRLGIQVYPFDPFQLVNRRADIWRHRDEWGRAALNAGKPQMLTYSSYGDYFCPTAKGFRQALKQGYARLVDSAGFDGLYFDFTHPFPCYNTHHAAKPHMNTDGVLDMILWVRDFLGPQRVFCGHTGWVPVLFFQDLCTVTAVFEEYLAQEPLPLYLTPGQGEFADGAPRTLVSSFLSSSAVAPGEAGKTAPPTDQVDAYLARCALVGIFPWAHAGNVGASDSYELPEKMRPWLRLFALRGEEDLGTMQFLPYHRQTAAITSTPFVRAATYWNDRAAVIILADSERAEPIDFTVTLRPQAFGWPSTVRLRPHPGRGAPPLRPAGEFNTFRGRLEGYQWAAYHLTPSP